MEETTVERQEVDKKPESYIFAVLPPEIIAKRAIEMSQRLGGYLATQGITSTIVLG